MTLTNTVKNNEKITATLGVQAFWLGSYFRNMLNEGPESVSEKSSCVEAGKESADKVCA